MVPDTPDIPEVEHQAHAVELVRPPLSIAPPHTTAWAANDDTPDESIQREAPKGRGGRAKRRRRREDGRGEIYVPRSLSSLLMRFRAIVMRVCGI